MVEVSKKKKFRSMFLSGYLKQIKNIPGESATQEDLPIRRATSKNKKNRGLLTMKMTQSNKRIRKDRQIQNFK